MTTYAQPLPQQARRRRQETVEALLSQLDDLRRRLYLAQANGVRQAGARDLKRELKATRRRLDGYLNGTAAGPGSRR
jgi:hypothetical protein